MDPNQQQALLDQLRDVAAPASPGWWPPAIGWWVLMATVLGLVILLAILWKKYRTKHRKEHWRRMALADHKRISESMLSNVLGKASAQPPSQNALAELSVLMRRVALVLLPRSKVAALTDDNWLQALDVIGNTREYSDGVGQLLYRAPYRREHHTDNNDLQRLLNLTESTIRQAQPERDMTISVSEDSETYLHPSDITGNAGQAGGKHAAL